MDGKALRVRQTLILEDAQGKELYKIQERMLRVKDSMEVEDARGQRVAMVKKALITPIRERWTSTSRAARTWRSRATSWTTSTPSARAATGWPKSPRSGSACATPTAWRSMPGQDDALILAVAVCIDEMAHSGR